MQNSFFSSSGFFAQNSESSGSPGKADLSSEWSLQSLVSPHDVLVGKTVKVGFGFEFLLQVSHLFLIVGVIERDDLLILGGAGNVFVSGSGVDGELAKVGFEAVIRCLT